MSSATAWAYVGCFGAAWIGGVAAWIFNAYYNKINVDVRRMRSVLIGCMVGVVTLTCIFNCAYLLGQGTYVRADTVEVGYARWIAYALSWAIIAFIGCKWLWELRDFTMGIPLVVLGAGVLAVFDVISGDPTSRWTYYALCYFFMLLSFLGIFFMRQRSSLNIFSVAAVVVVFLILVVYPIMLALGPANAAIVSGTVEGWVYFALDIVVQIILLTVLVIYAGSIPCDLMDKDKYDCGHYYLPDGSCVKPKNYGCVGGSEAAGKIVGKTKDFFTALPSQSPAIPTLNQHRQYFSGRFMKGQTAGQV